MPSGLCATDKRLTTDFYLRVNRSCSFISTREIDETLHYIVVTHLFIIRGRDVGVCMFGILHQMEDFLLADKC